jgi:hypothetical protein
MTFRPLVERIEERQLPSSAALATHVGHIKARSAESTGTSAAWAASAKAVAQSARLEKAQAPRLVNKFLAFRITNPKEQPVNLIPPFKQVLVQSLQPLAGQVYNIAYVAVKNGTARTFDASNGFEVRLNNASRSNTFPILTGTEQWKPNQWIVFYVLTKKYYPVSFVSGGFQLDLGGASSTLVPGPSGIFLRLKYNPANFAPTLNWIVAFGPGSQGGAGAKLGLPDTAINEIVAANTRRMDFGGHF